MAGCIFVFISASLVKKLTRKKRGEAKKVKRMAGGASSGYMPNTK